MHRNMKNGYFVGPLTQVGDPLRTSHWAVNFNFAEFRNYETSLGKNTTVFDSKHLSVMCKDFQLPTVEMNTENVYYHGGATKVLPTTMNQETTTTITFLESNALIGHKNILRWMNYCINAYDISYVGFDETNTDINEDNYIKGQGYGVPIYKNRDTGTNNANSVFGNFFVNNETMNVDLYDYSSGEVVLRVKYVNIFPTRITQPKIEYDNSGLYTFTVEFSYSRAVYIMPTPNQDTYSTSYNSTNTGISYGQDIASEGSR